jgi:hypothetical protein
MEKDASATELPWWKHSFLWMVIAGPAIVVVASFITLYLAVSRPNEIVNEATYRSGKQSDQTIEQRRKDSGMAPAMQARNHAATGVVPESK